MTCATCNGTGWVQVGVMCPNSKCQSKPFAENMGLGNLAIERRVVSLNAGGDTQEIANLLNAAVEAREAKLRGALQVVVERLATVEECDRPVRTHRIQAALDAARNALAGTGPDYVPAAEHQALKEHIEGTWGVLLAHLAETEEWTPIAAALAAELGVKARVPAVEQGAALHLDTPSGHIVFNVNKLDVTENDHDIVEVRIWGVGRRSWPPKPKP